MEHDDATRAQSAQQFAAWLRAELTAAGYNLAARGGGQRLFAKDSGITTSTVSRILAGEGSTDTRNLERIAVALRKPLADVMVRAGVLTTRDLQEVALRDPTRPPMTPDEAADELGITDPHARRVFIATTEALRTPPADGRQAEH